ncbi:hypothetical protein BJ878DRAFT_514137 [Calycina marina]|uniref:Uncharacterized protein n=1 Tax=Calycina marina TaxID=1763456 RepID=A0A9P7YZK2_9HELO|nr:hypothetical protein BJ878DRAFT_514137 [Calycina marina]
MDKFKTKAAATIGASTASVESLVASLVSSYLGTNDDASEQGEQSPNTKRPARLVGVPYPDWRPRPDTDRYSVYPRAAPPLDRYRKYGVERMMGDASQNAQERRDVFDSLASPSPGTKPAPSLGWRAPQCAEPSHRGTNYEAYERRHDSDITRQPATGPLPPWETAAYQPNEGPERKVDGPRSVLKKAGHNRGRQTEFSRDGRPPFRINPNGGFEEPVTTPRHQQAHVEDGPAASKNASCGHTPQQPSTRDTRTTASPDIRFPSLYTVELPGDLPCPCLRRGGCAVEPRRDANTRQERRRHEMRKTLKHSVTAALAVHTTVTFVVCSIEYAKDCHLSLSYVLGFGIPLVVLFIMQIFIKVIRKAVIASLNKEKKRPIPFHVSPFIYPQRASIFGEESQQYPAQPTSRERPHLRTTLSNTLSEAVIRICTPRDDMRYARSPSTDIPGSMTSHRGSVGTTKISELDLKEIIAESTLHQSASKVFREASMFSDISDFIVQFEPDAIPSTSEESTKEDADWFSKTKSNMKGRSWPLPRDGCAEEQVTRPGKGGSQAPICLDSVLGIWGRQQDSEGEATEIHLTPQGLSNGGNGVIVDPFPIIRQKFPKPEHDISEKTAHNPQILTSETKISTPEQVHKAAP